MLAAGILFEKSVDLAKLCRVASGVDIFEELANHPQRGLSLLHNRRRRAAAARGHVVLGNVFARSFCCSSLFISRSGIVFDNCSPLSTRALAVCIGILAVRRQDRTAFVFVLRIGWLLFVSSTIRSIVAVVQLNVVAGLRR